jgi:hypothetical protein
MNYDLKIGDMLDLSTICTHNLGFDFFKTFKVVNRGWVHGVHELLGCIGYFPC